MSKLYSDLYRFNGRTGAMALIDTAFRKLEFRYMVYYRWYQSGKTHFIARLFLRNISWRTNIQVGWKASVGEGFVIIHPGAIAINNEAVIGRNCTVYHGVTVGMEFRGKRKGNPVIGDSVWMGPNSTVVGSVTVGNDVLIAPGAFVNFDVPSHSIVLGNPGRIIPKDNATEGYIVRV